MIRSSSLYEAGKNDSITKKIAMVSITSLCSLCHVTAKVCSSAVREKAFGFLKKKMSRET